MNKVIILSVQPQYLHKILIGKKTIEIRKSMPKCEFPIDVYLYCTKAKPYLYNNEALFNISNKYFHTFIKNLNGKIVAKFTLNKVDKINNCGSCFEIANESYAYTNAMGNRSCLDFNDMKKYLSNGNGYAWHIDNLEIFKKPMELSEFYRNCKDYHNGWSGCDDVCGYAENNECYGGKIKINKPPQSWCYAYKEE